MAEEPKTNGGDAAPAQAPQPPRIAVVSQYVKDLSFENPRGPGAPAGEGRPEIAVKVNVGTARMGDERHEVDLEINVDGKVGESQLFLLELRYAGIFHLTNIPAESQQLALLIECPRLLFPFARRIVADCTRDGGLPPLMIDPIDFAALYRRNLQQASEAARAQTPAS